VGLAILTPRWMRYVLDDSNVEYFRRYGVNVWDIDPSLDAYDIANKAIDATEMFFKNLEIPMTLGEVGITDDRYFDVMAEHAVKFGRLENAFYPLDKEKVVEILKMCQ